MLPASCSSAYPSATKTYAMKVSRVCVAKSLAPFPWACWYIHHGMWPPSGGHAPDATAHGRGKVHRVCDLLPSAMRRMPEASWRGGPQATYRVNSRRPPPPGARALLEAQADRLGEQQDALVPDEFCTDITTCVRSFSSNFRAMLAKSFRRMHRNSCASFSTGAGWGGVVCGWVGGWVGGRVGDGGLTNRAGAVYVRAAFVEQPLHGPFFW